MTGWGLVLRQDAPLTMTVTPFFQCHQLGVLELCCDFQNTAKSGRDFGSPTKMPCMDTAGQIHFQKSPCQNRLLNSSRLNRPLLRQLFRQILLLAQESIDGRSRQTNRSSDHCNFLSFHRNHLCFLFTGNVNKSSRL